MFFIVEDINNYKKNINKIKNVKSCILVQLVLSNNSNLLPKKFV